MKVIYHSNIEKFELSAGTTTTIVPVSSYFEICPEKADGIINVIIDGKSIDEDLYSHIPCFGDAKLSVIVNGNTTDYTTKALVCPVEQEFAEAYDEFNYEYSRKVNSDVASILDNSIKLYAVEQSSKIGDITGILKKINNAYNSFRKICDQPKSHLKSINEVRPIETVKRVGYESIPYLASHSEDWLAKTASGLKPARLFSRAEDDEFQIYENRVIKTLIDIICKYLKNKKTDLEKKSRQLYEIINSKVQTNSFGFDSGFAISVSELIHSDSEKDEKRSKQYELAKKLCTEATKQWKKYRDLKHSRLYRYLSKTKPVTNPLKETNILLMDKKYSVAYKLWTPMQKEIAPKQLETASESDIHNTQQSYATYCKVLCEYTAHTLGFEEQNGTYVRIQDKIRLCINEIDGCLSIKLCDDNKEELAIDKTITCPINAGESFGKFSYDGQKIVWTKDVSDEDIEEFCALFKHKDSRGKEQADERKKYLTLRQTIDARKRVSKAITRNIILIPFFIKLTDTQRNLFADYAREKAKNIMKNGKYDTAIVALPLCDENEQKIISYSRKESESIAVLPLTMFDINSYRRMQNIMLQHIVLLGKESCPYCGSTTRGTDNRRECTNPNCKVIITRTACGNKNCKHKFTYLSYDVRDEVLKSMVNVDLDNFYYTDSLFQYKNIVDLKVEKKIVPICPCCGE